MADRPTVSVTILNPQTKLIERRDVPVNTGHQAQVVAVRDACQAVCRQEGARFFAVPSFVERGGMEKWLVFRHSLATQMASLERAWPTRDSAEMWMQHNA